MCELNSSISARLTVEYSVVNGSPKNSRANGLAANRSMAALQVSGSGSPGCSIGVAGRHRRRLELAREAVMDAGQQPRGDEIRIRIGAREPVFDAQVRRIRRRYAHRGAAIVDRPGRVQRHVRLGLEAPIAVGTRRADRHAVRERRQRARDRMAQRRAVVRRRRGEDVAVPAHRAGSRGCAIRCRPCRRRVSAGTSRRSRARAPRSSRCV